MTGDFSGGCDSQRWPSPLEIAFGHTAIPWPSTGVTSLCGPGNELDGRQQVARLLRLRQNARDSGQMAYQTPRILRTSPGVLGTEALRQNLAPIRQPQTTTGKRRQRVQVILAAFLRTFFDGRTLDVQSFTIKGFAFLKFLGYQLLHFDGFKVF